MPALWALVFALAQDTAVVLADPNASESESTCEVAHPPGLANEIRQVAAPWRGRTPQDLHREYSNVFRYGNRNAASHLWSKFLLERSAQFSVKELEGLFAGFCAVSGSPVRPHDYNRYKLTLDRVDGSGPVMGFMHYCCWPCVCDTQDWIRVDTRNVTTKDGAVTLDVAVIGNPCDNADQLAKPFQQSFGRGMTSLSRDAPEVRCKNGELLGAPLSDHGYPIINLFFPVPKGFTDPGQHSRDEQPGRVLSSQGVTYQDERDYAHQCADRKRKGYNSGMGEIFRRVAMISPIDVRPATPRLSCEL